MYPDKSKIDRKLYDAIRHSWKLNVNKAQIAEYALAVTNGIVVGVFKPTEWLATTLTNFPNLSEDIPNRFGFIGEEAFEEIKNLYMRRRVPNSYRKKGASNPIRYNY